MRAKKFDWLEAVPGPESILTEQQCVAQFLLFGWGSVEGVGEVKPPRRRRPVASADYLSIHPSSCLSI